MSKDEAVPPAQQAEAGEAARSMHVATPENHKRALETIIELRAELTALRSSQQRWERALVGLTPGGSEFVGDPEKCIKFVEERREALMRLFIDKKAELERLKSSQQEEMARAVRPWREQLQDLVDNDSCSCSTKLCARCQVSLDLARELLVNTPVRIAAEAPLSEAIPSTKSEVNRG